MHQVPSATFSGKSPIEAMKMIATNSNGFKMAYDIMGDLKPKAMVGFGGYPTIPPVLAALARGIPSMVHEQNSVMGRANRFLAPMVKAIAISFEDTKFLEGKLTEKSFVTGTPVARRASWKCAAAPISRRSRDTRSTSCASAAARARNSSPISCPSRCSFCRRNCATGMMVVQQCREEDIDRVFDAYEVAGVAAELSTFFDDLPYRMGGAHLVISRSGQQPSPNCRPSGVRRCSYPCRILWIMINWRTRPDSKKRARAGVSSRQSDPGTAGRNLTAAFRGTGDPCPGCIPLQIAGALDAVVRLADLVVTLAEAPETFAAQTRSRGARIDEEFEGISSRSTLSGSAGSA